MEKPKVALEAVLVPSQEMPKDAVKVEGYSFPTAGPVDFDQLFASYARTGFQATALAQGIDIINEML
ncbi:hypothetical protein HDU91_003685, partial [Kappamyces sp. JEL0680]